MSLITWKDEYSVGIEQIDEEHKAFIDMVNKAYSMADKLGEHKAFEQLADDMRCYAWTHFATEDKLMVKYDYPEAENHMSQHARFFEVAREAESKIQESPKATIQFLADWLTTHIMSMDKDLGIFLIGKDVN